MAAGQDAYPFPKFNFKVTFTGIYLMMVTGTMKAVTSFSEVQGLKMGVATKENTNINSGVSTLPTGRTTGTLVLKRGVIKSSAIKTWVSDAVDKSWFLPLTVIVELQNAQGQPALTWQVHDAWPVSLEVESLNATSNEVLHETLTLAHSGITFK